MFTNDDYSHLDQNSNLIEIKHEIDAINKQIIKNLDKIKMDDLITNHLDSTRELSPAFARILCLLLTHQVNHGCNFMYMHDVGVPVQSILTALHRLGLINYHLTTDRYDSLNDIVQCSLTNTGYAYAKATFKHPYFLDVTQGLFNFILKLLPTIIFGLALFILPFKTLVWFPQYDMALAISIVIALPLIFIFDWALLEDCLRLWYQGSRIVFHHDKFIDFLNIYHPYYSQYITRNIRRSNSVASILLHAMFHPRKSTHYSVVSHH